MAMEPPKFVVGKQVKIVRKNPDSIRSVPANDLIITHSKKEFFLTFSSIEPPPILNKRDLDNLQDIEALARSKLVISLEFAEAIVKALSTNIESYKQEVRLDASK